jgi:hypothetical protein
MQASPPTVLLTPHKRGDGTWYVEIIRPGVVYEHVGDFQSRQSAELWIRENKRTYSGAGASHRETKKRKRAFEE